MNHISKLKNIFKKVKLISNSLNFKNSDVKNLLLQNKVPIIVGSSLIGIGLGSYVFVNYNFQSRSTNLGPPVTIDLSDTVQDTTKIIENVQSDESVIIQEIKKDTSEDLKLKETPSASLIFQTVKETDEPVGLPTEVPYLIIGAGIAGISAARSIRASDPFAKVLIINSECQSPGEHKDLYPPYRRLLLSKFLWRRNEEQQKTMLITAGDVKTSSILYLEPDSFFVPPENLSQLPYGGISLLNGTRVDSIDPGQSTVTLEGSGHKISYKACLIATGSYPRRLMHLESSNNSDKDLYTDGRVSYFRSLNDYRNLFEKVMGLQSKEGGGRILIVGAGLLGTELSSSLSRLSKEQGKLEIIEVFKEKSHLSHLLPESLSLYIYRNMAQNHIKLIPQSEVVSIGEIADGSDAGRLLVNIRPLSAENDETITSEPVDHVIIAAGAKPDTSLLSNSNLEGDPILGGYLVNPELQARQGIFVAGDACSFYDPVLGCRRRVEHWDHSEETGHIAGHNMAAHVLNTHGGSSKDTLARLDLSELANDILRPKTYNFQSSFSFKLSMFKTIEALGVVDSSLETKTFVAEDFFDELDLEDAEDGGKGGRDEASVVPVARKTRDRLDMPGVVFYLRQKRIVGIVLWNCDDDIIVDSDFPSPLRTNVARKILAEHNPATIKSQDDDDHVKQLAADFDLSFFVNSQIKFLDQYTKKMKEKDSAQKENN